MWPNAASEKRSTESTYKREHTRVYPGGGADEVIGGLNALAS